MIKVETEEGEAAVKAGIERQFRAARYMKVSLASQLEMFPDRMPVDDRARGEGKTSAMEGNALENVPHAPGTAQYQSYCDGWHEGRETYDRVMKMKMGPMFQETEEQAQEAMEQPPAEEELGTEEATYETA